MAALGKVLLFINLLVAAGVVYVATDDWAKRQAVTGVALQHRLVLSGLPLTAPDGTGDKDAVPFPLETTGGYVVETINPALLKQYFSAADGGTTFGGAGEPPSTQLAEAKRVKDKVDTILRDATDVNRLGKLCGTFDANGRYVAGWLAVMAESYEERSVARALARDFNDPARLPESVKKAEAILARKFEAVLNKPDPKAAATDAEKVKEAAEKVRANPQDPEALKALGDLLADVASPAAARDESDRRRRLAHLLAHLDRDAAWQKRVGAVVGLKRYQDVIADQATRLRDMARSAQRQIELDQAAFVEQYEQLKNLALERSTLLDQQEAIRQQLEIREATEKDAVAQRKRQLDDRTAELDAIRVRVGEQIAAQTKVEKDLFDIQQRIGRTLERTFTLEDELTAAEAKVFGRRPN